MGKTRDLFKKMRDTKGIFPANMGTIKDRNGVDLTKEVARIHRRIHDLHDPDNHDGVITHLESDILECKVKWALGRITISTASGSEGISAQLFQIPK